MRHTFDATRANKAVGLMSDKFIVAIARNKIAGMATQARKATSPLLASGSTRPVLPSNKP